MTANVEACRGGQQAPIFEGSVEALQERIERHYDGMLNLYERLWGEHIHHGYWPSGAAEEDRRAAQLRMVTELIRFGGIEPGTRVLDVGCGVGGASFVLARELSCDVVGITLSDAQVTRARERARAAGLGSRVTFERADAMHAPFADESFDVVWSLESCELMPDKAAFLAECHRLLRPGGRLVVATWCCRGGPHSLSERQLLERIYSDFVAAYALHLDGYAEACRSAGFAEVRSEDWTVFARPTWELSSDIVGPLLRNPSWVWQVMRTCGLEIVQFFRAVPLMKRAYAEGLMGYGAFSARRHQQADGVRP